MAKSTKTQPCFFSMCNKLIACAILAPIILVLFYANMTKTVSDVCAVEATQFPYRIGRLTSYSYGGWPGVPELYRYKKDATFHVCVDDALEDVYKKMQDKQWVSEQLENGWFDMELAFHRHTHGKLALGSLQEAQFMEFNMRLVNHENYFRHLMLEPMFRNSPVRQYTPFITEFDMTVAKCYNGDVAIRQMMTPSRLPKDKWCIINVYHNIHARSEGVTWNFPDQKRKDLSLWYLAKDLTQDQENLMILLFLFIQKNQNQKLIYNLYMIEDRDSEYAAT